jgi:hypothetical protein
MCHLYISICVSNQVQSVNASRLSSDQNRSYLLRSGRDLTIAGEPLHAPVRVGMEEAWAGAKPP